MSTSQKEDSNKSKNKMIDLIKSYLPILEWGSKYNSKTFSNDLIVALIVTMTLIPQSLAYALLAGLPPEIGLYASMAPLVLYAIFGTSRALAVGPVAVASLMTTAAAGQLASQGTPEYLGARHCISHGFRFVDDSYGFSQARVSGKFSQSPCHLRVHYCFRYYDCGKSTWTRSRYSS